MSPTSEEKSRKKIALVLAAIILVVGVVLALVDPFAGGAVASGSGFVDNGSPSSTATIARETITSQTDVSATLGYSGTDDINIPNGTSTGSVSQAQQQAQSAEQRVQADDSALSQAVAMENSQGAATLLGANSTLATDEQALSTAEALLTTDEETGCPPASSSNVSTPIGGSSPGGSSSPVGSSPGGSSPGGSAPGGSSPGGSGPTGSTGSKSAQDGGTPGPETAPAVSSPAASASSTTAATLSGRVDPGGLPTSFYFEYGTSLAFGSRTPTENAGDGGAPVPVVAQVSGLSEGTTYLFELVATNSKGTATTGPRSVATATSSCSEQQQVVATDETAISEQEDTLTADEASSSSSVVSDTHQLEADEAAAANAEQALAQAHSTQSNSRSTYTWLPKTGAVLERGSAVYTLDGVKVPLLYGNITPWRALYTGVSDGPDVSQLNANLIALGFGKGLDFGKDLSAGPHFSAATTAAVEAWQRAMGAPATGGVALGDYVVQSGPLLVGTVNAAPGQAVQPGQAVLSGTSTTPVVSIALDPSDQSEVHVGDQVTVTLPNDSTTPGVVTSVGTVATSSSPAGNTPGGSGGNGGNGGGSGGPTIPVTVALTDPGAAGGLDQASVNVAITIASAPNALVVPVDALLALSGGGNALEEVSSTGVHTLVGVNLGIFDDANGTVQVTGSGLAAGQRIVVPSL